MREMETPSNAPPRRTDPLAEARRRQAMLILMVAAALFVIVPFLFWRGTWFGRPLSEQEIGQYLADREEPRHIQHALAQISEFINRGDPTVEHWYPEIVGLADHPVPEIRITLAWVMGADNQSEPFHRTLLKLLNDPEALVRRNAALSLVRFGDGSGRQELLRMLHPYTVRSPRAGRIRYRLQEGNPVDRGTLLARLEVGDPEPVEIRSPLPGTFQTKLVPEETTVSVGEEIVVLAPEAEHAWEALRALFLVGQEEDLPEVEAFAQRRVREMPPKIQEQAELTAAEIRRRIRESSDRTERKNP